MTEKKCITVELPYESVALLKQLLPTPWSEDLKQMFRVGQFLEGAFNEAAPGEPKFKAVLPQDRSLTAEEQALVEEHNAFFKMWAAHTAIVEVPQKVFSDVQDCLRHYAKKRSLSPTKAVVALIKEFELGSEE